MVLPIENSVGFVTNRLAGHCYCSIDFRGTIHGFIPISHEVRVVRISDGLFQYQKAPVYHQADSDGRSQNEGEGSGVGSRVGRRVDRRVGRRVGSGAVGGAGERANDGADQIPRETGEGILTMQVPDLGLVIVTARYIPAANRIMNRRSPTSTFVFNPFCEYSAILVSNHELKYARG